MLHDTLRSLKAKYEASPTHKPKKPKNRFPIVEVNVWTCSGTGAEPKLQTWQLRQADISVNGSKLELQGTIGSTPKGVSIVQHHRGEMGR